ncbi:MAG TPA: hypothetical protein VHQ24_04340 [Lachnospiraceae bacterium]|nr:hypothetical protein [Lachnospiraceae bacterium]HEX3076077.1 hypothetical protein [Lachnospiraceae bacterium]
MLYIFILIIIGVFLKCRKELFQNKKILYLYLILSILAIYLGYRYETDPYRKGAVEIYYNAGLEGNDLL